MASSKLTDRTELAAAPADGDLLHVVDVSDTTGSSDGTSKKIQVSNLLANASTEYMAISGYCYISSTGTFYYLPCSGTSQTETTSSTQRYSRLSLPKSCRLEKVSCLYQRGSGVAGRTIDFTAYDFSLGIPNLGSSITGPQGATSTSGGAAVWTFDTSDFDFNPASQMSLGINIGGTITSSTTLLGLGFTMLFRVL